MLNQTYIYCFLNFKSLVDVLFLWSRYVFKYHPMGFHVWSWFYFSMVWYSLANLNLTGTKYKDCMYMYTSSISIMASTLDKRSPENHHLYFQKLCRLCGRKKIKATKRRTLLHSSDGLAAHFKTGGQVYLCKHPIKDIFQLLITDKQKTQGKLLHLDRKCFKCCYNTHLNSLWDLS